MNKNIPPVLLKPESTVAKPPTLQCDCACAEIVPFLEFDEVNHLSFDTSDKFYANSLVQMLPVVDGYYAAISENSRFSVLNTSAREIWNSFDNESGAVLPDKLIDWKVIKSMLAGRLLLREGEVVETRQESNEVSAWLHITDRCNLRCDYCYLPHEKVDMSWETAKKSIDSLIRAAQEDGSKHIKLKIAGGEPLLRFELIQKVLIYAKQAVSQFSLTIDTIILTNGTLLNLTKAAVIKKLGARLMISLDGLEKEHDCQRKYISGKGSFQEVERALDIIQTMDISVDISVTISSRNAHGLADLVSYLLGRDLFFGFSFYRENALSKSNEDLALETKTIIDGMFAAFKVIEKILPNYNLLGSLADRANLSQSHKKTCSAGSNYLVYTPEGKISQCQMQLDKTVATVATIKPLEAIRTNDALVNLSVDEKEGCNTCEWKYWCAGGCPLETHRVTGRYDLRSPNCEIYKAIFPEIVRLEAMRVIKYHGLLDVA